MLSRTGNLLIFMEYTGTLPSIIRSETVLTRHSVVEVVNLILCPGGYITVWDVGNFLLDPPSERSNGDQREDEQESNKEESKKEPKVKCLAHHYHLSLLLLFLSSLPVSVVSQRLGTPNFVAPEVVRNIATINAVRRVELCDENKMPDNTSNGPFQGP